MKYLKEKKIFEEIQSLWIANGIRMTLTLGKLINNQLKDVFRLFMFEFLCMSIYIYLNHIWHSGQLDLTS